MMSLRASSYYSMERKKTPNARYLENASGAESSGTCRPKETKVARKTKGQKLESVKTKKTKMSFEQRGSGRITLPSPALSSVSATGQYHPTNAQVMEIVEKFKSYTSVNQQTDFIKTLVPGRITESSLSQVSFEGAETLQGEVGKKTQHGGGEALLGGGGQTIQRGEGGASQGGREQTTQHGGGGSLQGGAEIMQQGGRQQTMGHHGLGQRSWHRLGHQTQVDQQIYDGFGNSGEQLSVWPLLRDRQVRNNNFCGIHSTSFLAASNDILDLNDLIHVSSPANDYSLPRSCHHETSFHVADNNQSHDNLSNPCGGWHTSTPIDHNKDSVTRQAYGMTSSCCDCAVLQVEITHLKKQVSDYKSSANAMIAELTKRIDQLEINRPVATPTATVPAAPPNLQPEDIITDTALLKIKAATFVTGKPMTADICRQLIVDQYDHYPPPINSFNSDTIKAINDRRLLTEAAVLSKWAVFELFSLGELVGRSCQGGGNSGGSSGDVQPKKSFDVAKMKIIKNAIFQIYPQPSEAARNAMWKRCVDKINADVRYLFKVGLPKHNWLQVVGL